jgi:hypothetical protein
MESTVKLTASFSPGSAFNVKILKLSHENFSYSAVNAAAQGSITAERYSKG